jgi:pimeloyl-ACP methyl ester carboxylesterase
LILAGTADNVVDHRNVEQLARSIPGARVELLQGLGHLFFWERPDEVVTLIEDFLG